MPFSIANTITILRFPLLAGVAVLLYQENDALRLATVFLVALLMFMDTLDGVVARRRNEESLMGSALDIAADRAVEIVLWVIFAHLRLIPVVIPLVVIIRGSLTDSIRSVAAQRGQSAHRMMSSSLGKWLVASPPMRTGYSLVKIVAFLALALSLQSGNAVWTRTAYQLGLNAAWLAMLLCIIRGLPVLWEAPGILRTVPSRQ
jgi:CDP-diacylglycerol--glycerol-3-phosphate 3-phosphatidyltransferase